jgi:hypothetical protein
MEILKTCDEKSICSLPNHWVMNGYKGRGDKSPCIRILMYL